MNIKVAFDVSVLGRWYGRPDSKIGVVRVAEELLVELGSTEGIELSAVALTGDDPLLDSAQAAVYLKSIAARARIPFVRSFATRSGLGALYQTAFSESLARETAPQFTRSIRLLFMQRLRGLFYRLHYTYGIDSVVPQFDSSRHDVYHCPDLRLPPPEVTKGVARVLTVYDLIPLMAPQFVTAYQRSAQQQLLDRINFQRDWITCISQYVKDEFCNYTGMAAERVFVTPLAAADHFRPISDRDSIVSVRQRYSVPEGRYFLSLAAPQPRKNLVHLIRCFFRLLEETPGLDVNLVLAGSTEQGWLYDDIFATATSSPHRERIIFTGFVADEDLVALYSGATAFVFPSLYEGFGLPPLEAMACGTPVISSDATSLPEVVGGAGLMVKPTNESALCDAMLAVLNDTELCEELSQKGLARAAQFSWRRCADETVNVYRAAASE